MDQLKPALRLTDPVYGISPDGARLIAVHANFETQPLIGQRNRFGIGERFRFTKVPDAIAVAVSKEPVVLAFGQPGKVKFDTKPELCLLYTSPSPRDATLSRMPSSA